MKKIWFSFGKASCNRARGGAEIPESVVGGFWSPHRIVRIHAHQLLIGATILSYPVFVTDGIGGVVSGW